MKKKVIIISYYFPPQNTIASKRWSEMLPALSREFECFVFTIHSQGDLTPNIEESRVKRVRSGQILPFQETNGKKNLFQRIARFMVHDMRTAESFLFSWYFKHRKDFVEFCVKVKPDVIISTILPFSSALFAWEYKRKNASVRWVVDIRDSVSIFNEAGKDIIQKYLDRCADRFILRKADCLLSVSDALSETLSVFYKKQVHTIYNGFPRRFLDQTNNVVMKKQETNTISVYYPGRIYPHREQALFLLFEASKRIPKLRVTIRMIGEEKQFQQYWDMIQEKRITNIRLLPPTNAAEIEEEEKASDVLCLLEDINRQNDISRGTLTGKLFEYLCLRPPIMAICRKDSDINAILRKTNAGSVVSSVEEIIEFIDHVSEYENRNWSNIEFYSRESQAGKVAEII